MKKRSWKQSGKRLKEGSPNFGGAEQNLSGRHPGPVAIDMEVKGDGLDVERLEGVENPI